MSEVRKICYRWLDKAFDAGQKCPPFSDQRSEYYAPLFYRDWSEQMENELAAALLEKKAAGPESEGDDAT